MKRSATLALLAAVLLVPAAWSEQPETNALLRKDVSTLQKDLDALKKLAEEQTAKIRAHARSANDLREEVASLKTLTQEQSRLIKDQARLLETMNDAMQALNAGVPRDVSALRQDIASIRKEIDELRLLSRRLTAPPRISASFTPTPITTGTLRLDNRLGVTATVYVDGLPYSIPPLTVRTLPGRPSGSFVYEATAEGRGMGAPVRSALAPNETLTVTVY